MGVKQLWTLLGPVGRPVLLETMEGKTMAIDSSIWIYQFQATMRDKDGRALINAHVLGFLRRISKLLFYGIKPVFVFDGGAPTLKRMTIAERKKKKAGAAESHAKVAEKLLAAHMRREAIAQVQKGKGPSVIINEDTVYLEDLESNQVKTTPPKAKSKQSNKSPDSAAKKAKFHDHDPYRLPDVDLASISQPTSALAPDPRLATEDELRNFIDSMRPEDFDVSSAAFRELPTEVQYEIIGDLRLKSRQTSHKRLQTMLRSASTPLDFSKAQIRNLQQRNSLTQQLLETTDSIGNANVVIPVRIASERNKEYVLVKNQGDEGGWVLGIRNEGTQAEPIVIDDAGQAEEEEEDSEMEMEEVPILGPVAPDPDLREYHGRMALASIAKRHAPQKPVPRPPRASGSKLPAQSSKTPLFLEEEDDLDAAIQLSLKQQEVDALQQAIAASKDEAAATAQAQEESVMSEVRPPPAALDDSDDDLYEAAPSRLETALAFANTSPSKRTFPTKSMFGTPALLLSENSSRDSVESAPAIEGLLEEEEEAEMEEVFPELPEAVASVNSAPTARTPLVSSAPLGSDVDMEEVLSAAPGSPQTSPQTVSRTAKVSQGKPQEALPVVQDSAHNTPNNSMNVSPHARHPVHLSSPDYAGRGGPDVDLRSLDPTMSSPAISPVPLAAPPTRTIVEDLLDEEEVLSDWGRSPSPAGSSGERGMSPRPVHADMEDWDAAQEMDVTAEEGDFAQFMSQMKGQDLEAAQRDIDDEIRNLNKQKKVAMRDSEDITQQMISQIMMMLRLFGIPYITAPMEAEAQCAALASLGLVEGIITDDSDVFLFGGLRVFKNMFNQSKTVECFLLNDLARELSLDRDKLVRLAYLLGSDYVDGLPGVGPVVAMELMKEFPGDDGLHKFKEWWQKVQTGKDTPADNKSKFRRRFKKRFKNLYLPDEWPNPAVRDAYYHPAVDESEEAFKWGLPDLDALRDFFREELGWSQSKVDDLLLPIIRKMGQRAQAAATNRQGILDGYFDVSLGGTYAPRKRQAYSSKRLQQVVADFRAEQNRNGAPGIAEADSDDASTGETPPKKKRKSKEKAKEPKKAPTKRKARGGKARPAGDKKRKASVSSEPQSEHDEVAMVGETPQPPALTAKLRPRPKPILNQSTVQDGDGEQGPGDSDDEFIIKRPRTKL